MNVAMSAEPSASYARDVSFAFHLLWAASQGRNSQSTLYTRNSLKIKPDENQRAERPGASELRDLHRTLRVSLIPPAPESVLSLTSHQSRVTNHARSTRDTDRVEMHLSR